MKDTFHVPGIASAVFVCSSMTLNLLVLTEFGYIVHNPLVVDECLSMF